LEPSRQIYIYEKISHWFRVIKEVLEDPAVVPENVYNMTRQV
jgi:hypothetical protein